MRKISRIPGIVICLVLVISSAAVGFSYASESNTQKFDSESQYAKDLFEGKIIPGSDDPEMSDMLIMKEDGTGDHSKIVDIRKLSENNDSEIFQAVAVETKKVKVDNNGIRTGCTALQGSLLSYKAPMLALSGTDEDTFCDVTYFTTMVYSRKASPDPSIDYCYKITSIKGGVISRSDLQIAVSKIVLGYVEHGEYWVNGEGTGGVATLKNISKYTKTNPVTGTTYTTTGPTQNYYYCIEDEFSGIQTRTTIYVRRLNSGYTGNSYLDFVKGTAYGDW